MEWGLVDHQINSSLQQSATWPSAHALRSARLTVHLVSVSMNHSCLDIEMSMQFLYQLFMQVLHRDKLRPLYSANITYKPLSAVSTLISSPSKPPQKLASHPDWPLCEFDNAPPPQHLHLTLTTVIQ